MRPVPWTTWRLSYGTESRTRTCDLPIIDRVLCQLSYLGMFSKPLRDQVWATMYLQGEPAADCWLSPAEGFRFWVALNHLHRFSVWERRQGIAPCVIGI